MTRRTGSRPKVAADFQVGSLRASDYEQLKSWMDDVGRDFPELRNGLAATDKPFKAVLDAHGRYWWVFYEVPFVQATALMVILQGWGEDLIELSKAPEPHRAFFDYASRGEPNIEGGPDDHSAEWQALFLNLLIALMTSAEAIKAYGLSMDELLDRAQRGDPKFLIKAASIDRAVLFTEIGVRTVATALLAGDKRTLGKTLEAQQAPKKRQKNSLARFFARVMRDDAAQRPGRPMSDEQLVELFCHRLQLHTASADAAKNLREFLRRAKQEATT